MTAFRAYRLTPSGKIRSGDWIEAADEEEARSLAHELCDAETPTVELWLGARCVAVLACEDVA